MEELHMHVRMENSWTWKRIQYHWKQIMVITGIQFIKVLFKLPVFFFGLLNYIIYL